MTLPQSIVVYPTKHAKIRLEERYDGKTFKDILPEENLWITQDLFEPRKFYLNMDKGFVVLKRVESNGFVIVTITTNGRIDGSDKPRPKFFIKFARVEDATH